MEQSDQYRINTPLTFSGIYNDCHIFVTLVTYICHRTVMEQSEHYRINTPLTYIFGDL